MMDGMDSPRGRVSRRQWIPAALDVLIIIAAGVWAIAGLRTVYAGDALTSRLATVYSLTHDGTWYIDRPEDSPPNPFEQRTIDKVEARGRLISSKPPVLPLLMTGQYVLMHWCWGWDLDNPNHLRPIAQRMIFVWIVLPYLLSLALFSRLLRLLMAHPWRRTDLLAMLAFGTQYTSFAPQMNNHVPAAAMMIAAMYLAAGIGLGQRPPSAWRLMLLGFTASLVFTIEIPMTIYVALPGAWIMWKYPKQTILWAGLGALPVLALHFGLMAVITGNPLPVQISKAPFLFESSYWRHPTGIDALNEPKPIYLFHMTFGRHGAFLLYPILLLGFWGLLRAVCCRDTSLRSGVMAGAFGFFLLTCYYVHGTNNYGGASYGFRWYIGSMPVLLLMAAPALEKLRRVWPWAIIAILFSVSVYSTWECYCTPWGLDNEWTVRWLFGPSV